MPECLPLLLALLLLQLPIVVPAHSFIINVGIAVGEVGRCSEMGDAHRGHQLFANKLATDEGAMQVVDRDGTRHRILFNYTRYDDECDQQKHEALLNRLINQDNVHFLFGSTPVFAQSESEMANDAQRLIYHCCVGPDVLYEQDMKYVFGIQTSNKKYSLDSLKSMALAGNVKRLYIFSLEDNIFTSSTCKAGHEYATGVLSQLAPDFEVVKYRKYTTEEASADPNFFVGLVDQAINAKADAILGCDFKDPGVEVTKLLADREYYLKALWLTVAPAHEDYVPMLGIEASENALTAGQWHPAMGYADAYFGTTADYNAEFEQAFGSQPSYVAAGATATSYSLAVAIQEAFQLCSFPESDFSANELLYDESIVKCEDQLGRPLPGNGYDSIRNSLSRQQLTTFFGEVEFNRYRRNVAKAAATTQVHSGVIEAVLPLEFSNKALVMPIPKPITDAPDSGPEKVGSLQEEAFIVVVVVVVGSVLLVCLSGLTFLWWHKHQRSMQNTHLVISPDDLKIIHLPVRRWDGITYESGKAIYRNALVSLDPLTEVRLSGWDKGMASGVLARRRTRTSDMGEDFLTDGCSMKSKRTVTIAIGPADIQGDIIPFFGHPPSETPPHQLAHSLPASTPKVVQFKPVSKDAIDLSMSGQDLEDPHSPLGNGGDIEQGIAGSNGGDIMQGEAEDLPCSAPSLFSGKTASSAQEPIGTDNLTKTLTKSQVLKLLWRSKHLQHPNIVPAIGVVWSLPPLAPSIPVLVRECQELGSLTEVMENKTMELDAVKQTDIAKDIAQALAYLHAQENPRLKPVLQPYLSSVMLNRYSRAKLCVPLPSLEDVLVSKGAAIPCCGEPKEDLHAAKKKPDCGELDECVHDNLLGPVRDEELEDVLKFGEGLAYMLTIEPDTSTSEKSEAPARIKRSHSQFFVKGSSLCHLQFKEIQAVYGHGLASLLAQCCATEKHDRPSFTQIFSQLEAMAPEIIHMATQAHQEEGISRPPSFAKKPAVDELLYELFPSQVADALKSGRHPDPEPYSEVSLFFSDVCGYTNICSSLQPPQVMDMLHRLYSRFDALAQELCLFKVETVGDAYLCVPHG
uniref:Guanylate cyclase domain-containing protein n=2 Tax=Dunaliella tertiolecta TaxID=3047 RepID=A0A6S8N6M9_DUNTE|mmetsp:Transcript_22049/g.57482  ORF Transcript_22049/g.57482 Transcript_22049/m.57482 type:complete len:1082 (-) Transcript_22049:2658-5903(-)